MEVLLILPFVLLAMVLPKGLVLTVCIISLALTLTPLAPIAAPVAGGSFFILAIKHYATG